LNKTKRVVWVQLFASLGAIAIVVALWHFFPVPEILALIQQRVMGWGVWSAICYPILYACCNVLLLPGGILSIGSGFFFGLWWGFLIALIGNVAGAAISFLIGRTIGRRWLQRRLEKSKSLHALEPAVEREGWKLIPYFLGDPRADGPHCIACSAWRFDSIISLLTDGYTI